MKDTFSGALTGQAAMFLPGASTIGTPSALFKGFTGLNAGANSFAAIERSTLTKLGNSNLNASSMSATTWRKIFGNESYNGLFSEITSVYNQNELDSNLLAHSSGTLVKTPSVDNIVRNNGTTPSGDPLSAKIAKWKN